MLFKKLKKPDPKAEEKLREEIAANGGLEKGDLFAMILSAMITFIPVIAVLLGFFCFVAWLFIC
jgi:hypothetical protein